MSVLVSGVQHKKRDETPIRGILKDPSSRTGVLNTQSGTRSVTFAPDDQLCQVSVFQTFPEEVAEAQLEKQQEKARKIATGQMLLQNLKVDDLFKDYTLPKMLEMCTQEQLIDTYTIIELRRVLGDDELRKNGIEVPEEQIPAPLLPGREISDLASTDFHGTETDADISPLKKGAYKVALLAPKLILSAVGWTVGFAIGGNLGAAVGDGVGVFIGSLISLGIELIVGRGLGLDPSLKEQDVTAIVANRLGEAVILSVACGVTGFFFNDALAKAGQWVGHKVWQIGGGTFGAWLQKTTQATIAGAMLGGTYLATSTAMRSTVMAPFKDHRISEENLYKDLNTAAFVIFPAETFFMATSIPTLGAWFMKGSTAVAAAKSAGLVAFGGLVGDKINRAGKSQKKAIELEDSGFKNPYEVDHEALLVPHGGWGVSDECWGVNDYIAGFCGE